MAFGYGCDETLLRHSGLLCNTSGGSMAALGEGLLIFQHPSMQLRPDTGGFNPGFAVITEQSRKPRYFPCEGRRSG